MAAKWSIHILTTADTNAVSKKFAFLAPTGQYTGLGTETGITEASGEYEKQLPLCTVENLLASPYAERKTIRYQKGDKTRYADLIISVDKAETFAAAIVGKSYNGGTVKDAYSPRRATFR